ncbi:MobF family relaxase [Streptomyces sp. NBC_01244]|uniref:MobF family relaxase n=1 Tax=Streptomyces sp. NBC_01244 TaxID=2903797 RepID=UPI002E13B0DA|nr:relaxase domain-containing protein [Streptomyces sp. NBC_01244]
MLTIHPVSAGMGIDYLLSTVASDDRTLGVSANEEHWAAGADTPGFWIGQGAEALGLSGDVTQAHADALFKYGEDPLTGEALGRRWRQYKTVEERYTERLRQEPKASDARKDELRALVEREGERSARAGWEMVVSPVKSFAIAVALADDEGRERLLRVEERAFQKMWQRIESSAGYARIGANGVAQVETDGLAAAVFTHRSSRAGDPAFHRHIAISAKVSVDGKWLALDARPLHRQRVTFGEMYTAELERGMAEELGITAVERDDSLSFDKRPIREFHGVDQKLITEFSSRRQQTEGHLRELMKTFRVREGREPNRAESYRLAQAAALTDRPHKELRSEADERQIWRERARKEGLRHPEDIVERAQQESSRAARQTPTSPEEIARDVRRDVPLEDIPRTVVAVLEQQRETWTRPNAEAEVIRQLVAAGWHIALGEQYDTTVQQLTSAVLSPEFCELVDMPDLLPVPTDYLRPDGTSLFHDAGCTRYTSHNIKRAEYEVVQAAKTPAPVRILSPVHIIAALEAGHDRRGFTPSQEQLDIVHGVFTGDRRVQAVIGRAGSGKTTIMALLREVGDAYGIPVIGMANGQVQADVLGEEARIRTENIRRWLFMSELISPGEREWTLPAGAIVIVDEAGQAASTDMAALLHQVTTAGGRLLPVGDPLQLGAPGPGGLLAQIEAEAGALYLTEIRRFRDHDGTLRTWEIEASKALAEGDSETSFEAYHTRGRIHAGSADAMAAKAYEAWLSDTEDGLVSILIAPDNASAAALSARAREDRVTAGVVDNSRTVLLRDGNSAGCGDRIVTRAIDRRIQVRGGRGYVRNGDMWTVTKIRRDGGLVVKSTHSKATALLPAGYVEASVELGYAITKDRAQGLTTDTAHALFDQGMNRNAAYPSATRGKFANHMYLIVTPEMVPIVGDPDPVRTARQAWAQIVERDGTTRSATVAQRDSLDASEALHTLVPRLRFTLDDLAGERLVEQLRERIPMVASIVEAEAWPALRDVLTRVEAGGADPVEALQRAIPVRGFGDADDVAAVLHWRLHNDEVVLAALDAAEQQLASGPLLLAQLHLRLPEDDGSEKSVYAHDLASAITARAEELATSAAEDATLGEGWAGAYGPAPQDSVEATAWRERLASAAAYRDLAQLDDKAPLGPAPEPGPDHLRRVWRDGQVPVEDAVAAARVLGAAEAGARWLDALGPVPAPESPLREPWLAAAVAVDTYRERWDYGREDLSLGQRPADPVQALDYDTARAAVDVFRQSTPPKGAPQESARPELQAKVQQGEIGAIRADDAARADNTLHAQSRAADAAAQQALDARNRAESALKAAADPERRRNHEALAARAAELSAHAEQAAEVAAQARLRAQEAEESARRHAPRALEARADHRAGRDAVRALDALGPEPAPARPGWQQRPFGTLSENALGTAEASALARARLADQEADTAYARADRLTADLAPGGRIETEAAQRGQQVTAVQDLRRTRVDLTSTEGDRVRAEAAIAAATVRLEETGRFNRPVLRGEDRRIAEEQLAQATRERAAAEQRQATLLGEAQRLAPLAGDETEHDQLLEEWAQLGGNVEAVVTKEKEVTGGDADHARATGAQMRRRAESHRERAVGLRRELSVRRSMDPAEKQSEDLERAHNAQAAQQQRAQDAAQAAARQQREDEQNRRDDHRY